MWLDVSQELSIVAKSIIAVEEIDAMRCSVYTDGRTFTVAMPKSAIMSMIESRCKGQGSMGNVERLLTQIYQGQVTPRP